MRLGGPLRRGAERAAAEKKVAILEKALGHHPGSDALLLALLEAVSWSWAGWDGAPPACSGPGMEPLLSKRTPMNGLELRGIPSAAVCVPRPLQAQLLCTEEELEARWRRVLARHGGSPRLWRRYLQYRQAAAGSLWRAGLPWCLGATHASYRWASWLVSQVD